MTPQELQKELAKVHLYSGPIDGILGKRSRKAIDIFLGDHWVEFLDWTDERRQIAAEQLIYKNAKIEVGDIDGLVGEQTRYARTVWEAHKGDGKLMETWRNALPEKTLTEAKKPSWFWPKQSEVPEFFGPVGTHQTQITLPVPFRIAWDPEKSVTLVSCHEKVADPLRLIWQETLREFGEARFRALRLDMFGGCLNVRKMRGGSAWSMHSWGIAWDVDPDRNQLKWGRDKAQLDDASYVPFWNIVRSYGALSLGQTHNFDWMHFQFTSTI